MSVFSGGLRWPLWKCPLTLRGVPVHGLRSTDLEDWKVWSDHCNWLYSCYLQSSRRPWLRPAYLVSSKPVRDPISKKHRVGDTWRVTSEVDFRPPCACTNMYTNTYMCTPPHTHTHKHAYIHIYANIPKKISIRDKFLKPILAHSWHKLRWTIINPSVFTYQMSTCWPCASWWRGSLQWGTARLLLSLDFLLPVAFCCWHYPRSHQQPRRKTSGKKLSSAKVENTTSEVVMVNQEENPRNLMCVDQLRCQAQVSLTAAWRSKGLLLLPLWVMEGMLSASEMSWSH